MQISFLKWWLLITLILVGTISAVFLGGLQELYEKDVSRLSFVIIALFFYTSFQFCRTIFNISPKKLMVYIESGWFYSEFCLSIGFFGTVLGFILMLKAFGSLDFEDMGSVQSVIKDLVTGLGIALYTTLTGLAASMLLKLQCFILEKEVEKKLKEEENA